MFELESEDVLLRDQLWITGTVKHQKHYLCIFVASIAGSQVLLAFESCQHTACFNTVVASRLQHGSVPNECNHKTTDTLLKGFCPLEHTN
jgi:hypothetical protein